MRHKRDKRDKREKGQRHKRRYQADEPEHGTVVPSSMTDPRLDQLRDLHLPGDPSWWPPAPGWWLAALIVGALLVWLIHYAHRWLVLRRPYRLARRELDRLQRALAAGSINERQFVDGANALIKRLCIHVRGDQHAARLSDAAWLTYLDQFLEAAPFSNGPGVALGASRYAPVARVDPPELLSLLRRLTLRLEASA